MGCRATGFSDFLTLVSCCDFRVEDVAPDRKHNWVYAARAMQRMKRGDIYIVHMSFLKPLGVSSLVLVTENRDLRKKLLELPRGYVGFQQLARLIPLHRLADRVILSSRVTVIAWHVVEGIDYGSVWEFAVRYKADVYRATRFPVHTCKPNPGLDDVPVLAKRYKELLHVPDIQVRNKLLAFSLIALLDEYLMKPIKKLVRLNLLAYARELSHLGLVSEELRTRYLLRYYRRLSENYILGRYRVFSRDFVAMPKALVLTEPENCENLYGYLAYRGSTAHLYCGETALGVVPIDKDTVPETSRILDLADTDMTLLLRVYFAPFPFELYDPLENRWRSHPVPGVLNLLKKLGYVGKS